MSKQIDKIKDYYEFLDMVGFSARPTILSMKEISLNQVEEYTKEAEMTYKIIDNLYIIISDINWEDLLLYEEDN